MSWSLLRRRWRWFHVDIELILSVLLRTHVSNERCSSRCLRVLLQSIEWFLVVHPCWLCLFPSHSKDEVLYEISSRELLVAYFDFCLLFVGILRQFFEFLQASMKIAAFLHDLVDRCLVGFDLILALLQISAEKEIRVLKNTIIINSALLTDEHWLSRHWPYR